MSHARSRSRPPPGSPRPPRPRASSPTPPGGYLRHPFLAQLLLQALECRAGKPLALEAVRRRTARAGANGEVDPRDVRDRAQALLDDRLAEESGAAGDQEGLAPCGR